MDVVLLKPYGPARLTEYGKRWHEDRCQQFERSRAILRDVVKLADYEHGDWRRRISLLRREGVPTAISSGVSQYAMPKLIDHLDGKTSFTMPSTVAYALATAAPTSTTTGATLTEAGYTGYGRQTLAGSAFNAASAATPSISTNSGTITFGNCTGGTSTLLGFIIADSASTGAGNALWYGTLASAVISTTQTPPTIAAGSLSLSMNGT
jgi:hypothetical protein